MGTRRLRVEFDETRTPMRHEHGHRCGRTTTSRPLAALVAGAALGLFAGATSALDVKITPSLESLDVVHNGETVTIQRNQDTFATIDPGFSLTSRECPPFCIQPMHLGPGIETLGALEFIAWLERARDDGDVRIIDSRTASEYARGTIPSAENLPWDRLHFGSGADPMDVQEILADFGVVFDGEFYDFSQAQTLVLFCNGPWCGQSPTNIRTLVNLGYPAHKLKWYRGGLQDWHGFGLTVVPGRPD